MSIKLASFIYHITQLVSLNEHLRIPSTIGFPDKLCSYLGSIERVEQN